MEKRVGKWTLAVVVGILSGLGSAAQAQQPYQLQKLHTIAIGDRVKVQHLALSPDGRYLAIAYAVWGGQDNRSEILIVDVATGKEIGTISDTDPGPKRNEGMWGRCASGNTVHSSVMCFTPDGKQLVVFLNSFFGSGYVQFWDTTTFKNPRTLVLEGPSLSTTYEMGISPDGKHMAMRVQLEAHNPSNTADLQLRDTATGKLEASLTGTIDKQRFTRCLAFSPDSSLLAYAIGPDIPAPDNSAELFVWDVAAGRLRTSLAQNSVRKSTGIACPLRLAFVEQGKRLATIHPSDTGPGCVRRTWDLASGQFEEQRLPRLPEGVIVPLAVDGPRTLLAEFPVGRGGSGAGFLVCDSGTLFAFPTTPQPLLKLEYRDDIYQAGRMVASTPDWTVLAATEPSRQTVGVYKLTSVQPAASTGNQP